MSADQKIWCILLAPNRKSIITCTVEEQQKWSHLKHLKVIGTFSSYPELLWFTNELQLQFQDNFPDVATLRFVYNLFTVTPDGVDVLNQSNTD